MTHIEEAKQPSSQQRFAGRVLAENPSVLEGQSDRNVHILLSNADGITHSSLGDLGDIFGISRQAVGQIHTAGMRTLWESASDKIKQDFPELSHYEPTRAKRSWHRRIDLPPLQESGLPEIFSIHSHEPETDVVKNDLSLKDEVEYLSRDNAVKRIRQYEGKSCASFLVGVVLPISTANDSHLIIFADGEVFVLKHTNKQRGSYADFANTTDRWGAIYLPADIPQREGLLSLAGDNGARMIASNRVNRDAKAVQEAIQRAFSFIDEQKKQSVELIRSELALIRKG